ncbi:hypothetical protein [Pantoea stewartii]|uniref:hypothetical protein n=1 Tax=Pantoea stewartii TaxID=66269 RepID=UPI0021E7B510|nr:hypothetical protein [Pantoea stewartii]UYK96254.1 hypothetical protein NG832_13830 [Pantoea stewartii]
MKYVQNKIDLQNSKILDADIEAAENTVKRRERSLKRAERNLEQAECQLSELYNQRDILVIKSWGDEPNWQAIFDISNPTPAMYEYQQYWIAKKGLIKSGMLHCETNQTVFSVGFKTTTAAELASKIAMVEFLMTYIRTSKRNEKSMLIYNVSADECCHSFVFNTKTKLYGIATDHFMSRKEIKEFSRLDAALSYLQSISDTDIVSEPDALPHHD